MSLDLKSLHVLREVRARREGKRSALRVYQVRQCELLEQEILEQRRNSEQLMHVIKQKRSDRWKALFSSRFNGAGVLCACEGDSADASCIEQVELDMRKLESRLREAMVELEKVTADHVKSVRKLETWDEFVDMRLQLQTKSEEVRKEADQEEMWLVRHAICK